MHPPAKEQLIILVGGPEDDGLEEAPGFIMYGLGARGSVRREPPSRLLMDGAIKTFRLIGEGWEVVMWEFPMWRWPSGSEWKNMLSGIFDAMISAGAKVAWVGSETSYYADPPALFDPASMLGAVFAWRTDDGREGGSFDPDQPLSPATTEELLALRRYAKGLADVE